jgi:hypothetical protein
MQARVKRARETFAPFKKGVPAFFAARMRQGIQTRQD